MNHPGIKTSEIADSLKISKRSCERYLKQLREENKIEFRGSKKNGGYFVTE